MPDERFSDTSNARAADLSNQKGVATILVMGQHGFLGGRWRLR